MSTITFVVSDESVNHYGSRILTSGIDLTQFKKNPIMLYMHRRNTWNPTGDEVIGRWENVRVEGTKLLADAVFDEANEFAKKIAHKVKEGFIKMASIGIKVVETSTEKKHLKTGQTRATVSKSVLDEISICDMGGNDNALKLYNNKGEDYAIDKLNLKTDNEMSNLKSVALVLGLSAEASEADVITATTKLKQEKEAAQTKLSEIELKQTQERTKEADELVEKAAIHLKLEGDTATEFKSTYKKLFDADFENTKLVLTAMLPKVPEQPTPANKSDLSLFLKNVGGGNGTHQTDVKLTFDYLQTYDVAQLKKIKTEQPELYSQLVKDYANGVRHTS